MGDADSTVDKDAIGQVDREFTVNREVPTHRETSRTMFCRVWTPVLSLKESSEPTVRLDLSPFVRPVSSLSLRQ
jgi:hypothetical protein